MTQVWAQTAMWLGLALIATLLSIWLKVATAPSEIVVGTIAQLVTGVAADAVLLAARFSIAPPGAPAARLGVAARVPRKGMASRQQHVKFLEQEDVMNGEPEHFRMVRLHKAWADRYTILWLIIVVMQFGATCIVLGELQANPPVRTDILILLAVTTLTVVVWQAVGLGVARVHMLLAGIGLERLAEETRGARR